MSLFRKFSVYLVISNFITQSAVSLEEATKLCNELEIYSDPALLGTHP